MEKPAMKLDEVVAEIMKIHKSLPSRPGIEDVEASKALIKNLEREDETKMESIEKQRKHRYVSQELFTILQEMQKNKVFYQSNEQKREALKLLDLENIHLLFDELIQRASKCISDPNGYSNTSSLSMTNYASLVADTEVSSSSTVANLNEKRTELMSKDDSFLKKTKTSFNGDEIQSSDAPFVPHIVDPTLKPAFLTGQGGEKLNLIKLASLIEITSKKGTREFNLQNKLIDQLEWIPDSIGKLSNLTTLNLSENRLLILPYTIGNLNSLQKIDLHSNKISELPESFCSLITLISLNLSGNQLRSLPSNITNLINLQDLNVSSNNLLALPDTIGLLIKLTKLIIETNDIEEIPHTIGQCSKLKEFRADYNRIKALPEAIGRISTLEILSIRYNNVRQLPTTMSSMEGLKEINVSFNELESIPETLCLATSLMKMDISNNFADLQALPRSIGNLENLEELNMSNNQIRIVPDSFRMLNRLRVLQVEGNPLEFPPRNVIEMGAQAVVQYMEELVTNKDVKLQPVKTRKCWGK